MQYKLSDKAPKVTVVTKVDPETNKVIESKQVPGIYPFGKQCDPITDDNLTDSIAQHLLSREVDGKKEYEGIIIEVKNEIKK